ncbi:MAG: autotransporter-associated beta strand repeat-containing protein [Lewinellaceae bacterium]|nr:autotransporter-associated beta strand repeat-containing protein [Lewinellaceae bacterium]
MTRTSTFRLFGGFSLRVLGVVVGMFTMLLVPEVGFGQTSTWTGATSGAWLTAGNWSPSGAPSGTGAEAFININTQPTMGINMNGISGGNSSIGAIHFGSSATTARTISNSSGTVAGTMTLNGITINSIANTIIRNNSATTHTITNGGSQALGIGLGNATNNIINIDAAGGITIGSAISGVSRNLTKGGSGAGVLELTGANTYSGTTTVSGGTLRLNRSGGTTIPVGNNVTVNNGGTLRISTTQTLNNVTVDAGGTLILDAGLTVSGTFAINGTLQINTNGFVSTNAPTYGSSSTLIYNSGGTYGVGTEWTGNSATAGLRRSQQHYLELGNRS